MIACATLDEAARRKPLVLQNAGPPDGRRTRTRDTRRRLILTARVLIIAGDNRPSVARIADFAGVSVRAVFHHFPTLYDLYSAALDNPTTLHFLRRRIPADPKEQALAFMGAK